MLPSTVAILLFFPAALVLFNQIYNSDPLCEKNESSDRTTDIEDNE